MSAYLFPTSVCARSPRCFLLGFCSFLDWPSADTLASPLRPELVKRPLGLIKHVYRKPHADSELAMRLNHIPNVKEGEATYFWFRARALASMKMKRPNGHVFILWVEESHPGSGKAGKLLPESLSPVHVLHGWSWLGCFSPKVTGDGRDQCCTLRLTLAYPLLTSSSRGVSLPVSCPILSHFLIFHLQAAQDPEIPVPPSTFCRLICSFCLKFLHSGKTNSDKVG